jgi:hypothetical protein
MFAGRRHDVLDIPGMLTQGVGTMFSNDVLDIPGILTQGVGMMLDAVRGLPRVANGQEC